MDVVEGQGVLISDERGSHVFWGATYERLAPLLRGSASVDEILDRLDEFGSVAEVYYALMRLHGEGFLVDGARGKTIARRLPFLDSLGSQAARKDADPLDRPVLVRAKAPAVRAAWAETLGRMGLVAVDGGFTEDPRAGGTPAPTEEQAAISVVIADDYLDQDLAPTNREALASGCPWILCRPWGTVLWIGPLFVPGRTACWECLRHRLARNRPIETFLAGRRGDGGRLLPATDGPGTCETAAGLVATQVARALASAEGACELVLFDTLALSLDRHPVSRRVQCPECGDPGAYAARLESKLVLEPRPKAFTADGGHRSLPPEGTVSRLAPLVDPLTGVITELRRIESGDPAVHVYAAGFNQARPSHDLATLRAGLRRHNSGKGWSDAQARASALGEAVERYSGVFQGDEPRIRARVEELGDAAVDPRTCLQFSEAQYRRASEASGGSGRSHDWIPDPFDEARPVEWTPLWSLTGERVRYLPTAFLYYAYPVDPDHRFCVADSNGNAAGNTIEEAVLQGFMELVERDSVALWWYNRVRRPALDLETLHDPEWGAIRDYYERLGRELWILDLTSDLGIPVFAAVTRRVDSGPEEILLGLGAHLDPTIAFRRAVSEMNQMLVSVRVTRDRSALDPVLRSWLANARVATEAYLAPSESPARRRLGDFGRVVHSDLRDDVLWCREVLRKRELEMLVLDQTRPDIGFPVVKVVVPGLRHFRPRFGPGRLFDAPVTMRWLDRARKEDELNPVPFFL